MEKKTTTQDGNLVGEDQAGRDINKPTINFALPSSALKESQMARLIEKFKKEEEENTEFRATIEKIQHYSTPVRGEQIEGLEQKLAGSGQEELILFAKQTKELFAKKLAKYQFSESAQQIHAYLLAEVFTRFNLHVYPAIRDGEDDLRINELIQSKVVEPIEALLEENILELYADELSGMIYFLTGNCHIKWV